MLDFFLRDGQRRNKTKNFIRRAISEKPLLHASVDDLRPLYFQLQYKHQSLAANAFDKGKAVLYALKSPPEDLAHFDAVLQDAALEQCLHHR